MDIYLSEDTIEKIFKILKKTLDKQLLEYNITYKNNLEQSLIQFFTPDKEEYLHIDDLGTLDIEESLRRIKGYYCNSFLEDNHLEVLHFLSDFINKLSDNEAYKELINEINSVINEYSLIISCANNCLFIGEELEALEGNMLTINTLKMKDSFQDFNKVEMVHERMKDAIFLFNNKRYTACLALVAFSLEGFLRGIFKDNYEYNQEQYRLLNAELKEHEETKLILSYTENAKPSNKFGDLVNDTDRVDLHFRKIREKQNNSIVELKIKNEYVGLVCNTEKEFVRRSKNYTLEKLIEKAKVDNLIDEQQFFYESFDYLRKIRNNIVHFDVSHQEVVKKEKTKKILLKILEFINTKLYTI